MSLAVFSAVPYPPRGFHEDHRSLVLAAKAGSAPAIKLFAILLAPHLQGFHGIIVPVPRSSSAPPEAMTALGEALVERGVGVHVVHALARVVPIPSSRRARQEKCLPPSLGQQCASLAVIADAGADVLLLDDVISDGTTLLACTAKLREDTPWCRVHGVTVAWALGKERARGPLLEAWRSFIVAIDRSGRVQRRNAPSKGSATMGSACLTPARLENQ